MSVQAGIGSSRNYIPDVFALLRLAVAQFFRPPSNPRRHEAARRLLRQVVLLTGIGAVVVIALMFAFDAFEIGLMPKRGSPDLWPVRILTDFAKDAFVLGLLAGMLLIVALMAPRWQGPQRARLLAFGTRLQFVFFAVLTPVLAGELIKFVVGRGRPFVGGSANAFNFEPFNGTEAHFSFPSAHAITGFALAFAVAALWPRARGVMIVYALAIAASRLVLLAHHPSDVVAGALIGVIGAMAVRYWFAARRLGFVIRGNGEIAPLTGRLPRLKRVARTPSAP